MNTNFRAFGNVRICSISARWLNLRAFRKKVRVFRLAGDGWQKKYTFWNCAKLRRFAQNCACCGAFLHPWWHNDRNGDFCAFGEIVVGEVEETGSWERGRGYHGAAGLCRSRKFAVGFKINKTMNIAWIVMKMKAILINYFASSDPHHDISKQLVDTTFVWSFCHGTFAQLTIPIICFTWPFGVKLIASNFAICKVRSGIAPGTLPHTREFANNI